MNEFEEDEHVINMRFKVFDPGTFGDPDKFLCIISATVDEDDTVSGEGLIVLIHLFKKDTYQECKDYAYNYVKQNPNAWAFSQEAVEKIREEILPTYHKEFDELVAKTKRN